MTGAGDAARWTVVPECYYYYYYYYYYQQCASMLKCECVPSDACMLVIMCISTVALYSDLSAFLPGMAALVPWRRA